MLWLLLKLVVVVVVVEISCMRSHVAVMLIDELMLLLLLMLLLCCYLRQFTRFNVASKMFLRTLLFCYIFYNFFILLPNLDLDVFLNGTGDTLELCRTH